MRNAVLLFLSVVSNAALAHESVLPHDHPHGLLPNLDAVLAVVLLAALAFIAIGRFRRGGQ